MKDTVEITAPASPYTAGTSGYCNSPSYAAFSATVNPGAKTTLAWYGSATGGSIIGKGGSISVSQASTTANLAACGTPSFAAWAVDTSSYAGALLPSTTIAGAPCAGGTSGGSTGEGGATPSSDPMEIMSYQSLNLTGASVIIPNLGYAYGPVSYTVTVYANNPTATYCGSCTPSASYDGPGAALYTATVTGPTLPANNGAYLFTIPMNYTLSGTATTPVKYWIGVTGGQYTYFACTPAYTAGSYLWATPQWDNTGNKVLSAVSAQHYSSYTGSGNLFNLTFNVGNPYTCGRFLVCANTINCTLPVDFISFDAEKQGNGNLITWSTAKEEDVNYYVVESSTDGTNFYPLAKVQAQGNTSLNNYSYTDNSSDMRGNIYYRIVEVDNNGNSSYSDVKTISTGIGKDVVIIPNPNNGTFKVEIDGEASQVNIVLYNAMGQQVYQTSGQGNGSSYSTNINIQSLASGVYYLYAQSANDSWVKKVVKE